MADWPTAFVIRQASARIRILCAPSSLTRPGEQLALPAGAVAERVQNGKEELLASESQSVALNTSSSGLSKRQKQVWDLLADGPASSAHIADCLGVTPRRGAQLAESARAARHGSHYSSGSSEPQSDVGAHSHVALHRGLSPSRQDGDRL